MKSLPKITQNKITKQINNNKEVCKCKMNKEIINPENKSESNITNTLNKIFSGLGYSYNIPVKLTINNQEIETSLVAKTNKNIVTLENEVYALEDIEDLKILD